jgi:hypothetical protein
VAAPPSRTHLFPQDTHLDGPYAGSPPRRPSPVTCSRRPKRTLPPKRAHTLIAPVLAGPRPCDRQELFLLYDICTTCFYAQESGDRLLVRRRVSPAPCLQTSDQAAGAVGRQLRIASITRSAADGDARGSQDVLSQGSTAAVQELYLFNNDDADAGS